MSPTPPKLSPAVKNPHNEQATKRYIFNETGNIMLASTELASDEIGQEVRDVFAEVAVFFSAMTKAMSNTIDPETKEPYSIYDYKALEGIIEGSGMFVNVTREDVHYKSSSYGATFSKDLIQALLGLATGAGELGFAQAMIASIGKRGLKIGGSNSNTDSRVANIVFVCEYLLGMPIVSAIVVYVDSRKFQQQFSVGPCLKESTTHIAMDMHKDTFLFVTPKFIKEYSSDLLSVESDLEYAEFVDYLQDLVERKPLITAVETMQGQQVAEALTANMSYAVVGIFLTEKLPAGVSQGVAKFTVPDPYGGNGTVKNAQWQDNVITFDVTGSRASASPIGLYINDSATEPFLVTPGGYTIVNPTGPVINGVFDHANNAVSSTLYVNDPNPYKIKGSNFGPATGAGTIRFGNSALGGSVQLLSWSDSEITFKVTHGLQHPNDSDEIVVKTKLGDVVITQAFAIAPMPPAPTVSSVSKEPTGTIPNDKLVLHDSYRIHGTHFGTSQGVVEFSDSSLGGSLSVSSWHDDHIVVTATAAFHSASSSSKIKVTTTNGQAADSTTSFTF